MKKSYPQAYARPCPENTAGHLADNFDPILDKVIEGFTENSQNIYFMTGVTNTSKGDDKLPYCSLKWTGYGCKRTPNKEKKLKPVLHAAASTTTCQILNLCPDKLGLQLVNMLTNCIKKLIPNREHRPDTLNLQNKGWIFQI